jgi:spore germination protein
MMRSLIFVLSFAVVALLVYVNSVNTEKEQLTYLLQGQYTQEMADASGKLTDLKESVQKTLLFQDEQAIQQPLEDIWRLSSEIRDSVASLPLDQGFSNEWMNYLTRLGDYARITSDGQIPNDEWQKVMAQTVNNLSDFSTEWEMATASFFQNDVSVEKWMANVESTQPSNNWQSMGQTLKTYRESDFPLTTSESDAQKKKDLRHLEGKEISKNDAVAVFKKIFPAHNDARIHVTKSRKDAPYPFYHLEFQDGVGLGYADITQKGGQLLSLLFERPNEDKRIDSQLVRELADRFKQNSGFTDIVLDEVRENHTAWHMTFVRVEPRYNAKVYSDAIQFKVAKDNGDLLGMNAMEYIQKENLKEQPINKFDWKKFFNEGVTVQEEELAYTENEQMEQRLCYKLIVTKKENDKQFTYRIMVDTETGKVLKSEHVD